MAEKMLIKVLGLKDINQFVVKEVESDGAKRYQQMDKMLQKTYNAKHVEGKGLFKEGSFVAAFVSPDVHKADKQWLRGVVLENCHQKNFLFGVYFPDHGFDKTCHKSQMRELVHHMYPSYVPFQAFNYYLTDIDHKKEIHSVDAMNEIYRQLETNNFTVLATIEYKDRTGRYGRIDIDGDNDLAAILISKGLVEDIHRCHRYGNRSTDCNGNYAVQHKGYSFVRKTAPKGRNGGQELQCKCYDIIKYKRKELLKTLEKIEFQNNKKSTPEERLTQSI